MMGTTHYKLGIFYYVLFSTVPFLISVPFLGSQGITLAGILVAGIAALLADADQQHSKFNLDVNPVTGAAVGIVDTIKEIIITIIGLIMTVGLGILILYYSKTIIVQLRTVPKVGKYAYNLTYGIAIFLILVGVSGKRTIRHIPIIGTIYNTLHRMIDKGANLIKRVLIFLIYASLGAVTIVYNYSYLHDGIVYIIGLLFVAVAIFPHRTFLHSLDGGLLLFSLSALYLSNKIGYTYLANAFIIGYFSHLYLSDILTKEGVPLSCIPTVIKALRLHEILNKFKAYRAIYRVLNIRIVIPLTETGSREGSIFELFYVAVIMIVAIIAFFKIPHASLKLI